MPRTTSSPGTIVGADDRELTSTQRLQVHADALYRAAVECSRQHERAARLSMEPAVRAEHKLARQMCSLANGALGEIASAYERAAARYQPEEGDSWWRRANILWFAAREYQLHHQDCDVASQGIDGQDPGTFGELQVEYELAASALLAMRQAADAYRRTREGLQ
jgi:hypothetical protein